MDLITYRASRDTLSALDYDFQHACLAAKGLEAMIRGWWETKTIGDTWTIGVKLPAQINLRTQWSEI